MHTGQQTGRETTQRGQSKATVGSLRLVRPDESHGLRIITDALHAGRPMRDLAKSRIHVLVSDTGWVLGLGWGKRQTAGPTRRAEARRRHPTGRATVHAGRRATTRGGQQTLTWGTARGVAWTEREGKV